VDLDAVVGEWLTLPQLAEQIGQTVSQVRQLVRERRLVTVPRGTPPIASVPASFVHDGHLIKGLAGALTVLRDAGFSDIEAIRWLHTEDDALAARPVDFMAAGRDTAVKRRAMTLAF
jgi:hypothetical protein